MSLIRFWCNLFPFFLVLGRWWFQKVLRIFIPMHSNIASQVSLVFSGLFFNCNSDWLWYIIMLLPWWFFLHHFVNLFEHWLILSEDKQRSIDIETICELCTIVLGSEFPSQVNLLTEYLKVSRCLYFFLLNPKLLLYATQLCVWSFKLYVIWDNDIHWCPAQPC